MYVFIDDSGDPGFAFERGSSRLLVFACLILETSQDAESLNFEVETYRMKLGRKPSSEFKFAQMRLVATEALLEIVDSHSFSLTAVLVDKANLNWGQQPKRLYELALAKAIGTLPNAIPAVIKIDGKGDRKVKLKKYDFQFPPIKRLSYVDSRSDRLIQLADVVAGCIRRAHDPEDPLNPEYADLYSRLLKSRTKVSHLKERPGT